MSTQTPVNTVEVEALVTAFNAHFKTTASSQAVYKLLGSPHVRAWYADYRAERAREKSLPDDWKAAGLTAAEWDAAQSARGLRREARAKAAENLAAEAARYDREISRINASAYAALERAETPFALALEGGYEQLSLAAQIRVEQQADPEAREACLKKELAEARAAWVVKARAGEKPF
jgi:hypothetical protein